MKKTLVFLASIIIILSLFKQKQVIIPKESIRFRIISNSNSKVDQEIKRQIVQSLKDEIIYISSESSSIQEARQLISEKLPTIESKINLELNTNNYSEQIMIKYGENYFPKKEYKGVTYEEGNYESLVITLGKGNGENFWCVLFPPLCNVDETKDIQYTTLIKEILNKYNK